MGRSRTRRRTLVTSVHVSRFFLIVYGRLAFLAAWSSSSSAKVECAITSGIAKTEEQRGGGGGGGGGCYCRGSHRLVIAGLRTDVSHHPLPPH